MFLRFLYQWTSGVSQVPTVPGLEYTLPDNLMHYTLETNRLHFNMPENRLHYTKKEED